MGQRSESPCAALSLFRGTDTPLRGQSTGQRQGGPSQWGQLGAARWRATLYGNLPEAMRPADSQLASHSGMAWLVGQGTGRGKTGKIRDQVDDIVYNGSILSNDWAPTSRFL